MDNVISIEDAASNRQRQHDDYVQALDYIEEAALCALEAKLSLRETIRLLTYHYHRYNYEGRDL